MVARARGAGAYRSAAEVAEAMGLKLRRVRQLLELADAPAVIQEAVDPGVLVPAKDPRKPGEKVPLLLTNALATRPFYDLVFEDELARLKAKKRVVLSNGDVEAREAEKDRHPRARRCARRRAHGPAPGPRRPRRLDGAADRRPRPGRDQAPGD